MKQSFEIRTENIPADYDEMMAIQYGTITWSCANSRFIEAGAVRKSAVRLDQGMEELPMLCLNDANY